MWNLGVSNVTFTLPPLAYSYTYTPLHLRRKKEEEVKSPLFAWTEARVTVPTAQLTENPSQKDNPVPSQPTAILVVRVSRSRYKAGCARQSAIPTDCSSFNTTIHHEAERVCLKKQK